MRGRVQAMHAITKICGTVALACCVGPVFAQIISASDFQACLGRIRVQAQASGITNATFDRAAAGLEHEQSVIDLSKDQPEFRMPIWDYLAMLVDDERVADGKARLKEWASALATAEQRYGVDRYTITAVWGVESDYGRAIGKRPLVQSLATLSCSGARQPYFRGELIATLQILQNGDIRPESLVGSWAGAFGHTQFMPSTFQRLAVELKMSQSEIHAGVRRAVAARLMSDATTASGQPVRAALLEFLLHGVKYVYPPEHGALTRGVPTGYAAPPLNKVIAVRLIRLRSGLMPRAACAGLLSRRFIPRCRPPPCRTRACTSCLRWWTRSATGARANATLPRKS